MPSIEARLKAANADLELASPKSDRRSADAVFLSTASITPELSRVNSTPLSSDAIDSLGLQSSSSQANEPSLQTMAPPKPGPADTLYPSPSGGFVPSPEEGQDWRLKSPPAGRNAEQSSASRTSPATSSPASNSRALPTVAEGSSQRPILNPIAVPGTSTPTRPPSLPSCPETASKIASASTATSPSRRSSQASNAFHSPALRPVSTASSSRHRLSAISPLAEGASLPSSSGSASTDNDATNSSRRSTASQRDRDASSRLSHDAKSSRPESTVSFQTARNDDDAEDSIHRVHVRDFAFPPEDPRHHGQLLPEPQTFTSQDEMEEHNHDPDAADDFYIEGADDENEFDGDEGDHANVPEGIYTVLYEFDPVSEHELAVQPGDVVHVVGSLEGGWAIAVKNGDEAVKGLVPATYLEWSAPLPE